MPFLFVDYDQGAGGEFFCSMLSQSPECRTLVSETYESSRTKIKDIFNQEFLKPCPRPQIKICNPDLFDIVPTHRQTALARSLLPNVQAIRIKNPIDQNIWKFVVEQRIKKVILAHEPNDQYFLGFIKIQSERSGDKSFLRHVRRHNDNLDIILMSKGQEPSQQNRECFLNKLRSRQPMPEPDPGLYDLVVLYDDLIYAQDLVSQRISETFQITVAASWLSKFRRDYENFIA